MSLWQYFHDEPVVNGYREFAARHLKPVAAALDKQDLYPYDIVAAAAERGFNSLILPTQYGGGGATFRQLASFFEEMAAASASAAISLNSNFQVQNVILRAGSQTLQSKYLPLFAKGLKGAYALTEANHGSDIRTLDTTAELKGDHWVLTGQKSFITSGLAADLFVILAQTPAGVSVFAVPRESPNLSTFESDRTETFGLRNSPHVELLLDKVVVPRDHLLGVEGDGLKIVLRNLNYSRTLNAAMAIGIARSAFDESLDYVKHRKAFDKSVFDFQGIQWYFSEMLTEIDAARLLLYRAADAIDQQKEVERYSSEAKFLCCRVANRVAAQAIQVCGAYGTMTNSPFNRYFRDAKVFEIGGGSMEVLKNTIGKYLQKNSQAVPEWK
ncbi:Acyl-CoA dehydrogenase domain-containing protein [Hydrogenophaga intermedia]|uniref:Acyl-CoA dehydrogenase domain-containing protein n=1 Tax=Hydrogenophaga intermedia TaxID=65786 RepID=A0A1L1PDM7_HYDIT|nr:acyl-CoA dehydrogenase family protein [Hydrogenophaga intermedia]CDN86143.1 Acyl-CoA dehydrogenase domain-containing protein [Hydrogenophaga intermedia]